MDEALTEVKQERHYDPHKDLCPIEHLLFGSSLTLTNGKFLNTEELMKDHRLARDADFLLKPFGLTTGKYNICNIDEIRTKRNKVAEEKGIAGRIRAWHACFTAPVEVMMGGYQFDYFLGSLNENGMLKNEFRFQFIDKEGNPALNKKGLEAFRKIELANDRLFDLAKDETTGILTITYRPLQGEIKK